MKNLKSRFFCNICLHNLKILQYFFFTLFVFIMQIVLGNNFNNKMSFGRIKREKILAESILREYKSSFPYVKSNSFIETKINAHCKSLRYKSLIPKLFKLADRYTINIKLSRQNLRKRNRFKSYSQFITVLKSILLNKGYANCGELNYVLQDKFLKRNINAHMVCMQTLNKNSSGKVYGKDHSFLVYNLNKNAKLYDPSTWGSKAIIADAWCNIVMPAYDALSYYRHFFSCNPEKEFQIFFCADKIKLPDKIC